LNLTQALHDRGALLDGHFRLSSGRHSNRFIQKFRILEDPKLVEPIAHAMAGLFTASEPTIVVSAAVGGIVVGYEVARVLGVKGIFVEKESGVPTFRRGFAVVPKDRVLIVEDVITTGRSVREVLDVVRAHDARIVGVCAIVQRGPVDFGVPFQSLLDLLIESYEAADCPQCKAGEPITDPGSRRI
jgi:orotate phosphoribosyltransferase